MTPLTALILATASGLGLLWLRARFRANRLTGQLEVATQELEALQTRCARLAPSDVVERVISDGLSTEGEKKEVTALFVDLVGFTALSEKLEPSLLVRILNGYFERMSQAVTDHRGHVSTFLGDGVLALFGALRPNPWQGNDAVHAALAMRGAIAEYNQVLETLNTPFTFFTEVELLSLADNPAGVASSFNRSIAYNWYDEMRTVNIVVTATTGGLRVLDPPAVPDLEPFDDRR